MAEKTAQNYSNHTRLDPPFHFFVLPVFAVTLIATIVNLVRRPGLLSAWLVVLALAALLAILKVRSYATRVQDRVIRLEERLRLTSLLSEPVRARIPELSETQLIALRFASDAEIPALVGRCLADKLSRDDIKKAVSQWRADYWRV
jgi:uncharacterized membrane protein YdbT with pleckstrin-like domain